MGAESSITPLRPEPEVVHVCIIDADSQFSHQLGELLATELPRMVNIVGTYDGIPEELVVPYEVNLVIFDPELDDFKRLPAAVSKMKRAFGRDAVYAVHADSWAATDNRLKEELQLFGVSLGFRRFDLRKCIELVTKIALREPPDSWAAKFAT
jgi:hypothetical protein